MADDIEILTGRRVGCILSMSPMTPTACHLRTCGARGRRLCVVRSIAYFGVAVTESGLRRCRATVRR